MTSREEDINWDYESPSKIANSFYVQEPISASELYRQESQLPTSKLYSLPFPKSDVLNLFTPPYIKQIPQMDYPDYPSYKRPALPPNISRPKRKKRYARR